MSKRNVSLPLHGRTATFVKTRSEMGIGHPMRRFTAPPTLPPVALPIDWTKDAQVSCPMDGNDNYGDCMVAMAAHCDNVRTFMLGKGKESTFDTNALIKWYLQIAGGDNGLDEGTLIKGWESGLVDNSAAKIIDFLDIDINDSAVTQFAMDRGFDVCLMWSVPDAFLNQFRTGAEFLSPMNPNPNNGHGTPLIDCRASGDMRLWTWGGWCWVSKSFVASVQPGAFVVFSTRGFDQATGLDAKGVHIVERAKDWVACGGKPIPASVLAEFPPAGPTPPPGPLPPVPPPTPQLQIRLPAIPCRVTGHFGAVFTGETDPITVTVDLPPDIDPTTGPTITLPPETVLALHGTNGDVKGLEPFAATVCNTLYLSLPKNAKELATAGRPVTLNIPPWLLAILSIACALSPTFPIPAPWNIILASVCAVIVPH